MTVRGTVRSRHRSDRSRASPSAPAKKSKSKDLDFFICAAGHNIICVLARNIISSNARTSFLICSAQMNDVALRANDVLRNDVGLRPMMLRFAQTFFIFSPKCSNRASISHPFQNRLNHSVCYIIILAPTYFIF